MNHAVLQHVRRKHVSAVRLDIGIAGVDGAAVVDVDDRTGNRTGTDQTHAGATRQKAYLVGEVTGVGNREVVQYGGLSGYDCRVAAGNGGGRQPGNGSKKY